MAANVRKAVAEGRSDCVPIFLSEIPLLFHRKIVKPDVSLVQVSMIAHVLLCVQRSRAIKSVTISRVKSGKRNDSVTPAG